MIIQHFNYATFKDKFYQRINDVSLFEVGEVNYIKVIMECLVVRYALKGKIRPYLFYTFPSLFINAKHLALRIRNRESHKAYKNYTSSAQKKENLLVDNGRKITDSSGQSISMYFHTIRNYLDLQGGSYFHYIEKKGAPAYPDEFHPEGINDYIKALPFDRQDKTLVSDLNVLFSKIRSKGLFDKEELDHIESGLVVFFENYRAWKHHLSLIQPERVFVLGHYHREGLIMACRQKNITVLELQHGLIAKEDIFYVMPDLLSTIRKKSLFSDKLFIYGEYWRDVLSEGHEFSPQQIKKVGYYLYENQSGTQQEENFLTSLCKGKKVVLVTTQPALRQDFINYLSEWIANLKQEAGQCVFLVKIHPADKEEWYDPLKQFPGVLVTRTRLEVLFKYADIHVTSYSTTLYDALRYGVKNYSVNFSDSADYVKGVVEQGISALLQVNEFPVIRKEENPVQPDYYFETPDLGQLFL